MLSKLKSLLLEEASDKSAAAESQLPLATAALLVEVMVVDNQLDSQEERTIKALLRKEFRIADNDLDMLFDDAREEVAKATSLFQFTRTVNDNFSLEQKFRLIKNLWQIAYADGDLDKYEEHIIRRIAELIYIPHSEFIRAKVAARTSA